jgi:hypothetical protein
MIYRPRRSAGGGDPKMREISLFLLVPALTLAACEAKIGKDEVVSTAEASGNATGSPAAGKAEEGQLSIKAPGFDMKINIPKGVSDRAEVHNSNQLVYPGSEVAGLHIEAGTEQKGQGRGGVELRFTSSDSIDKVASWYRDPARASGFAVASAAREGDAVVITGSSKSDGDPFALRLTPSPAGGTDARLTLSDGG